MGNLGLVAVGIVFVVIVMLGQSIFWLVRSFQEGRNQEVTRRLGTDTTVERNSLFRAQERQGDGGIDMMLRQAGSPYPLATLQMFIGGAGAFGALAGLIVTRSPAGILGAIAAVIPIIVLRFQANKRIRRLTEQLPEAIDLMSRSLQAGHGLSESMRMTAEELPDPIGSEFARVYEENNLGRDLRDCLQNLTRRNPGIFDLQIFVSSMLLQRDTGGNLVEILQNISATVRSRFLFEGKLAALTSEAKFTAWVLGSLPFFVSGMIMVKNPDYLAPLWTDPLGNFLMAGCVVAFSFGVFLMYDFSKVEV